MLSGRGIDGELRSKFGELTENFWKSSSGGSPNQAKNFQAIYLASEGGSNGGGKTLSELKSNDGKKLISTESDGEDKVKKFFGICVGRSSGNGCKEKRNNASVVMVGDDPNVNALMAWEGLKNGEWGDQTSLVRSGHSYDGLFNKGVWKGGNRGKAYELRGLVLQNFLNSRNTPKGLSNALCPWSQKRTQTTYSSLQGICSNLWGKRFDEGKTSLIHFLNSDSARQYFDKNVWQKYGNSWQYLALLTLLNLWTDALSNVYFDGASNLFSNEVDKFRLEHLMNSNGKVIYLDADNGRSDLKAISYHSGGDWEVNFCPEKDNCKPEESLTLVFSNNQFCISNVVCVSGDGLDRHENSVRNNLKSFGIYFQSVWTLLFSSSRRGERLNRLFMALLVACFKDVEKVSFNIQKPSKEGKVIFKLMGEKK